MRTANEMREFAARYNVTSDLLSAVNLERCPFEKIVEALMPDERVVFCFGALHEKAIALTNYRLIHVETRDPAHGQQGGMESFSYDQIISVLSGNMLLHIQLDGHEDLIYGNLDMERIREAAELIGDVIQQYKSAPDPISVTDELKKFKELLDMGAISQEEFEAKKRQLLSL